MPIQLPPWLGPAAAQGWGDLAAKGQQLQLERARIQQEGIDANMRAQASREAQAAENARQQQQIQYQKAYRDADLGLRQQEADLKQQQFQQEVKTAATKSAAMMRISQRIAAGDDPSRVYMEEGPAAGATPDALIRANRSGAAFIPKTITGNQGAQYTELSPGHWKITGNVFDQPKTKAAKPTLDTEAPAKILYDESGGPVGKSFRMSDGTYTAPRALNQDERDALAKAAKNKPKQPTQKDIDHLKSNPDLKDKFDKEFGAGASDEVLNPPTEPETP